MHQIPDMVHPLSTAWDQPNKESILVDETHAVMSSEDVEKLHTYDTSIPTGVYEGKMWKRTDFKGPGYILCWYGPHEDPQKCSINSRIILPV
jgi:hypothetical protein